jgi:predicted nucleic acid-binding protein
MERKYLIDSNPVIDFFNGKLTEAGKNLIVAIDPAISVITHIELLSNKNIPLKEWEQIQAFIQVATVYQLDDPVVEQTIILRQQHKIKTPDAVIAATALIYDFTLITRNLFDFKNIPGLNVIDPHTL